MKQRWTILLMTGLCALAAPPDFVLENVAPGVWAAIVSDTGKAGGNAGFVVGEDGVVVIDTFQDPEPAKVLLAEIRKVTRLPIRFVVNTHYHLDHVNGNDVFAAAGATVIAHRNVRAWMRSENLKMLDATATAADKARVQTLTLPTVVHEHGMDLYLGSRRVEVRFFPGHTGGDSVVVVPDAHVVFGGDLLWKDHIPNLIDASTQPWIESLEQMRSGYRGSKWIPGHGEVASDGDVVSFRTYLVELRKSVADGRTHGKTGEALVRALLPGLQAKCGKWGFFQDYAAENIRQTEQEFLGTKRLPPAN
jgi:glyoxylase-like metal-dependent hydrolase (beta-lactamase superfamily II)